MFTSFVPHLAAYRNQSISIGGEYSKTHNTINKAEMFNKYASQLGYNTKTITNPNKLTITPTWMTYAINGGILFFAGEGKPTEMYWNYLWQGGNTAYGIKTESSSGQSSYGYTNLNQLNLSNTDLVFYLGCNTGQLNVSNNLVSTSKSLGAKISIGWKEQIRDDAAYWVERFMIKQTQGGTINDSINYADSYLYPSESTKSWHIGIKNNSYLNMTLKSLQTLSLNSFEDDREKKIYKRISKQITQQDITKIIKESFKIQNEDNYKIEYNKNDLYEVYDYILIIDGFRTDKGYTVFVKEDEIEVVNNMEGLQEPTVSMQNVLKNSYYNENQLVNETLNEYKKIFEKSNKTVTLESTLKRLDTKSNKRYLDVNILIYDFMENTNIIVTESYEI